MIERVCDAYDTVAEFGRPTKYGLLNLSLATARLGYFRLRD